MDTKSLLRNRRVTSFRDMLKQNARFRMRLLTQPQNYGNDRAYIDHALAATETIAAHYKMHLRREIKCWQPKKSPLAHMEAVS